MRNSIEEYWSEICQIHLATKHYMILAEELSPDYELFLQPLKEHRDAYDHIIRVYSENLRQTKNTDSKQYQTDNMSKALSHEYRAFFDTADWLTLLCRERLNSLLDGKTREEIEKKYPQYIELKKLMLNLPEMVCEQRKNKDSDMKSKSMSAVISDYMDLLDSLLEKCKELELALS